MFFALVAVAMRDAIFGLFFSGRPSQMRRVIKQAATRAVSNRMLPRWSSTNKRFANKRMHRHLFVLTLVFYEANEVYAYVAIFIVPTF